MKNTFFQFKHFRINQDKAAMKVCTDACILGAYIPLEKQARLLDIGAGTGLLALMSAQRNPCLQIDAVEIEASAYQQAFENVQNSSFSKQIQVHLADIQTFETTAQYDCIVSNPPFYTDYLQSGKAKQDNAWHTNTLPTDALLEAIARLLTPAGKVWILLPPYQMELFTQAAKELNLYTVESLDIYTLPTKPLWRIIRAFSRQGNTPIHKQLLVTEKPAVYTQAFIDLLKDYYLAF